MKDQGEKPPAKRARGKRWLKIALVALAALAALAVAWLLAPTVLGGPEPPPLWTEADLPAAPDPPQNGWHEIVTPSRANVSVPPDLVALLRSDNPNETRPLLERARAQETLLGDTLKNKPSQDALAAFERALAKPRFADACPVRIEQPCRVFPLLGVHRTALLESLRRALAKDWPGSVTLLAKTLRADIDFATTSRTLVSHLIALANLRDASELAGNLFEAYRAERARDPSTPALGEGAVAALTSLDADLARLDPSTLDARRAVIADYLIARKAPDLLGTSDLYALRPVDPASGQAEPREGLLSRIFTPLLFDRGATQAEINARFAALRDAIAASAPPPTFPVGRERPVWWLYNFTGKAMLDALVLDWSGPLRTVAESRARIEALRPGLRKLAQDLSRT
jgi:hypothetical protein